MINTDEVLDTVRMTDQQRLDIHTIIMGISLLGCTDPNSKATCQKIYDKITRQAEHLVATGEAIEQGFGIPIVNKRISVTPTALVAGASGTGSYVPFAVAMDNAAKSTGINFISDFSVLVRKEATQASKKLIASIPEALAIADFVCSSVSIGSTRAGINIDAVAEMDRIIKDTAERTVDRGGFGCAKLVVFYNVVENNPFMASALHGVEEPDCIINVGVPDPGVVHHALKDVEGQPFGTVAGIIKKTTFRVTRMGQLMAQEASRRLDVLFSIVDLSLTPTPAIGDNVARILEEMGLGTYGTHGTTAALALLDNTVEKEGVMASSHVGDLSDAFIPISEGEGMIAVTRSGTLHLNKLETMACMYSVGLDMTAIPGDTTTATLPAIIADGAAIGMINSKTTIVRLIPIPGKVVGDTVKSGGLPGSAPAMPVHAENSNASMARGGRIPAPMQSLRN